MSDNLRDRIADTDEKHYQMLATDGGWLCACGHRFSGNTYREWRLHKADAVIEALEADYVLVPKGHTHARIHAAAREAAKASDFQVDDDDTECDTTWVAPGEIAKMMGADDE